MFVMALAMLLTLVAAAPPASAQEVHTASQAALDAALQQHTSTSDADRDTVLRLLEREEVQKIAGEAGLDVRRATSAVATLDGPELAKLAAQARQAEQALAGGQSITISTTLIIIALLVIILIVVAVD
jgi:cell division protein FtsL